MITKIESKCKRTKDGNFSFHDILILKAKDRIQAVKYIEDYLYNHNVVSYIDDEETKELFVSGIGYQIKDRLPTGNLNLNDDLYIGSPFFFDVSCIHSIIKLNRMYNEIVVEFSMITTLYPGIERDKRLLGKRF